MVISRRILKIKIYIKVQLGIWLENLRGSLFFANFEKLTMTRMYSLEFLIKPLWQSKFSLKLESCSLQLFFQHSTLIHWILLVNDQSTFYDIRRLPICINIKAFNHVNRNNRTFWKHFWNIWDFILLLAENDSALKVSSQTSLRGLVAYEPIAYKNKV